MASVENTEGTNERPFFPFFRSYFKSIDKLPERMQLALYRAIALYSLDFQEPDFSQLDDSAFVQAVWEGILPNLQNSVRKYLNGSKGGAPKGNKNGPNGRRGNQPTTNQQPTENQAIKNKKENKKENKELFSIENDGTLVFPFHSPRFFESWTELRRQPKWKKKTISALQKNLDALKDYPEDFAIAQIDDAIAKDKGGIVYAWTPDNFEKWKKEHQTTPAVDMALNTDPSLYNSTF